MYTRHIGPPLPWLCSGAHGARSLSGRRPQARRAARRGGNGASSGRTDRNRAQVQRQALALRGEGETQINHRKEAMTKRETYSKVFPATRLQGNERTTILLSCWV